MQTLQELRMRTAYMMEEMRRRAIDETLEKFKVAARHYYETSEGGADTTKSVSYTHLDVYKRQAPPAGGSVISISIPQPIAAAYFSISSSVNLSAFSLWFTFCRDTPRRSATSCTDTPRRFIITRIFSPKLNRNGSALLSILYPYNI